MTEAERIAYYIEVEETALEFRLQKFNETGEVKFALNAEKAKYAISVLREILAEIKSEETE